MGDGINLSPRFTCPRCRIPVSQNYFFCPNCGKQLKSKPLSIGFGSQIGVYLVSFFLPPFGVLPGIRYLRQSDDKSKMVGLVAIGLSVVSIGLSVYYGVLFYHMLVGSLNSQLTLPALDGAGGF
jgi:hypothetical protein